jgi:hypothetical protein
MRRRMRRKRRREGGATEHQVVRPYLGLDDNNP